MSKAVESTPAVRIARDCFAVRVRLLNRIVTRIYDEALRPVGMTANQMNILAVLENMTEAQPSDLCRVLYMEKSTVSRNVERMRQQGWLHERPGPDGRAVLLATTARGRALLIRAMPLWEDAQEQVCKLLGESGAASVARLAQPFFPPGNKR
jgi:DNA-binding MarR family transcriptional regulator